MRVGNWGCPAISSPGPCSHERGRPRWPEFAKIGLAPDTGLSYTLPLRVGRGRTRELLLTARTFAAAEAERIGAVETIVDDGTALERAVQTAAQLAQLSAPMVSGVRRLIHQADQSLAGLLAAEGGHPGGPVGRQAVRRGPSSLPRTSPSRLPRRLIAHRDPNLAQPRTDAWQSLMARSAVGERPPAMRS